MQSELYNLLYFSLSCCHQENYINAGIILVNEASAFAEKSCGLF